MWAQVPFRSLKSARGGEIIKNREYLSHDFENAQRAFQKLRSDHTYIDFKHIPQLFANTRKEDETLKYLRKVNRVAGVIRARDEFPEVNITHPRVDISRVRHRSIHHLGVGEPWLLNIDQDEEVVRCVLDDLQTHNSIISWYMWAYWTRFIVGRPNRMLMKLMVGNEEECEGVRRGGDLRIIEHYVSVDVYTATYPRVLLCNVADLIPGGTYRIGDLRLTLPEGVKLAPKYAKSDNLALIGCDTNIKTGIYESFLTGHFDASRWHDLEMVRKRLQTLGKESEVAEKKEVGQLLTTADQERIKKLAAHLGKDYEEVKTEMMKTRLQEAKKPPKEKKEKDKK